MKTQALILFIIIIISILAVVFFYTPNDKECPKVEEKSGPCSHISNYTNRSMCQAHEACSGKLKNFTWKFGNPVFECYSE